MTALIAEPSGAHRAALTLHGLARDDREWVLQSLDARERALLLPLLGELRELGIPPDLAWGDDLPAPAADPEPAPSGAGRLDGLDGMDDAGYVLLAGALAAEPPRIGAALLAGRPREWRDRLLARLPAERAAAIVREQVPASACALRDAVRAQFEQVVAQRSTSGSPSSRWGRLRRRWLAPGPAR